MFAATTDIGKVRARNDDAFLIDPALGLLVVADGVGTRHRGDLAARLVTRVVREHLRDQIGALIGLGDAWRSRTEGLLRDAVQRSNIELFHAAEALSAGVGMATTLDAVLVRQGLAFVGHVGDSRTWLVRAGQARLLTDDHTVAAEKARRGEPPGPDRARNMLQRALGLLPSVRVDLVVVPVAPGDRLLACSDGLGRYVTGDEIAAILSDNDPNDTDRLVGLARARGGGDNITAARVRIDAPVTTPLGDTLDLRRVDALASLTARELRALAALLVPREVRAGTLVCREGAPGTDLYLLRDGEVAVTSGGQHLATLGPGDAFGTVDEREGLAQPVSALATRTTQLWVLTRARRVQLSHQEESIALALWRMLAPTLPAARPAERTRDA